MYHATLKVNGKVYMGYGATQSEALHHAKRLISDKISGGFACVIKPLIKVEAGTK